MINLDPRLKEIQDRLFEYRGRKLGEEATKQAFIIPFLSFLGYDVLDTSEVYPEYTAGDSNSEAVDYALCYKKSPVTFLEAKKHLESLHKHIDQLNRYVKSNNKVVVGTLTNGLNYGFFLRKEDSIEMEETPFYQFNLTRLNDSNLKFIKFISETRFSIDYLKEKNKNLSDIKEHYSDILSEVELNKIFQKKYADKDSIIENEEKDWWL